MTDTTAPTVQFVPQTAREFLSTVKGADGKPLAIAGARGRFSKAATEALAKAHADGFVFIGEAGHPQTEVKTVKAPKPAKTVTMTTTTAPVPTQPTAPKVEVDPKEVRAWAKANGHEVGERGRIHGTVIGAFLASGGKAVGPKAKAVTAPKPVRVRTQSVAYGLIRRGDAPKHVSEPLLAISSCYSCKKPVGYCTHEAPIMPKWAGGHAASLTKAEAK
jgi:hypothetical protein